MKTFLVITALLLTLLLSSCADEITSSKHTDTLVFEKDTLEIDVNIFGEYSIFLRDSLSNCHSVRIEFTGETNLIDTLSRFRLGIQSLYDTNLYQENLNSAVIV